MAQKIRRQERVGQLHGHPSPTRTTKAQDGRDMGLSGSWDGGCSCRGFAEPCMAAHPNGNTPAPQNMALLALPLPHLLLPSPRLGLRELHHPASGTNRGDRDGSVHEASKHIHMPELVPSSGYITELKHAGLLFYSPWYVGVFCVLPAAHTALPDLYLPTSPPKSRFTDSKPRASSSCISQSLHPPALPGEDRAPKLFLCEPPTCYRYGLIGPGN